jgi:Fe-S cluster biosynthesis and repair protein YggX
MVDCALLGQRLVGLPAAPFPTELGQRIFERISQKAWLQWLEHSKLLINEHNLNLSDPAAREFLQQACEAWMFAGRQAPPSGWEPKKSGFIPIVKKPLDPAEAKKTRTED